MVDMGIKKAKTTKIGEYWKLGEALHIWFRQQREEVMPITGPILAVKAKLLFPQLYPDADKSLTASNVFSSCFCRGLY